VSIHFIGGVVRKHLCVAMWSAIVLALVAGATHAWWAALPSIGIAIAMCAWNRAETARQSSNGLDLAHLEFIESMAQALDARDPYTAGHSFRVSTYAFEIARGLRVAEHDAETIRVGALLHDIGKIGIPDAILQKSGRLTPEEYGLIKLHPQIGRKILEKLGRFQEILPVVELHHEDYDGSGYPYKLAAERIPLGARIVHVADAFDSMVTHRHYRDAFSVDASIAELLAHAGSQFDPEVVAVLVRLVEQGMISAGDPGQTLLRMEVRSEALTR